MICEQSYLIQDYADTELSHKIRTQMAQHLLECAHCQKKLKQVQFLKDFIHKKIVVPSAPSQLVQKISVGIYSDIEKNKRYIRKRNTLIAALLILSFSIAITAFTNFWRQNKIDNITKEIIYDHIKFAIKKSPWHKSTSEKQYIEEWLSKNFQTSVKIPFFKELKPNGVRLGKIQSYTVAIVFYQNKNQKFSLFITNEQIVSLEEQQIKRNSYKGYSVLCWCKNNITYMLVAEDKIDRIIDSIKHS